jgi:hypothetical protein
MTEYHRRPSAVLSRVTIRAQRGSSATNDSARLCCWARVEVIVSSSTIELQRLCRRRSQFTLRSLLSNPRTALNRARFGTLRHPIPARQSRRVCPCQLRGGGSPRLLGHCIDILQRFTQHAARRGLRVWEIDYLDAQRGEVALKRLTFFGSPLVITFEQHIET